VLIRNTISKCFIGCLCVVTLATARTNSFAAENVSITIDATSERPDINPFIYGQFIEHLGRCIYGGLWAEMLEDRKFYFPVTEDYDPYKDLQDTPFPVVGASPWQMIGPADGVTMVQEDSFVGKHTPQVAPGSGIRQKDLGVVEGKQYEGYVWLKAVSDTAGPVTISLITSDGATDVQQQSFPDISTTYEKHSFSFTAPDSSDAAQLELAVEGDTPVLIGTLSLMPADNVRGMRADTLKLLKKLNAPMYRWPGGNFVSGYDWRDGIGPRDLRPPRKNPAWTGVEHNDMGMDEFLDFCREVNAEPLIAVNTGFGDDYSAAQQVEYCNGSAETVGGSWRVANGHPKPYGVKYWCVGNEMFGPWQLGFMQVAHYALKHNLVARAILDVDPSIELIGVGDLGRVNRKHDPSQELGWSEFMLRECSDLMDYISEHFYRRGRAPRSEEGELDVVKHAGLLRESVREKAVGHRKLQKELGLLPENKVPIAMDEWNYWHSEYIYGELGCRYDLADALGVAAGLHEFFRNTDIIEMAHYAQTINVIGCIKTTKTQAFFSTTGLPLMLYRKHFGTIPVELAGDYSEDKLDVVAASTADGKALTIGVVNPTKESVSLNLATQGINLGTSARQWIVGGDDPTAYNDEHEARIQPAASELQYNGKWKVPALSFAILRVEVRQ